MQWNNDLFEIVMEREMHNIIISVKNTNCLLRKLKRNDCIVYNYFCIDE